MTSFNSRGGTSTEPAPETLWLKRGNNDFRLTHAQDHTFVKITTFTLVTCLNVSDAGDISHVT